jgi:hypothetical protein
MTQLLFRSFQHMRRFLFAAALALNLPPVLWKPRPALAAETTVLPAPIADQAQAGALC